MNRFFVSQPLLLMVLMLVTVWIYYPGLSGTFVFDDYSNIVDNEGLHITEFSPGALWQATLSGTSGPLKRPVAVFSFAVNHVMSGLDPQAMKIGNLVIHLINGLLVYLFCRLLFRALKFDQSVILWAPFVITALWLVHPINVTSVSYIVQRMTSLSSGFMLLAMVFYLHLRARAHSVIQSWFYVGLILMCWALGMFSKEIALSLSIYLLLIEWCTREFKVVNSAQNIPLYLLWILLALPWFGALVAALMDPGFLLSSYKYREFTVEQRVMTEWRILVDYLRQIMLPDVRNMGLYQDDIIVSTSPLNPISTILSLLALVCLLFSAFILRRRSLCYCLGVLWFFGGHILESTIYPLELKFLHRNYLPLLGVLFAFIPLALWLRENHRRALWTILVIVFVGYTLGTRSLSHHWSEDYRYSILEAEYHPYSVRAHFRAGQVYKVYSMSHDPGEEREKYRQLAQTHFSRIETLDPADISGRMAILETELLLKQTPSREIVENLLDGLVNARIEIGIMNIVRSIKNCMVSNECKLEEADYHSIIEGLLNNSSLAGDFRRRILVIHADYLADYKNNVDAAIKTVREALLIHPNLEDIRRLVEFYDRGGYPEYTLSTLDYLEEQDKLGRYRQYISERRKLD